MTMLTNVALLVIFCSCNRSQQVRTGDHAAVGQCTGPGCTVIIQPGSRPSDQPPRPSELESNCIDKWDENSCKGYEVLLADECARFGGREGPPCRARYWIKERLLILANIRENCVYGPNDSIKQQICQDVRFRKHQFEVAVQPERFFAPPPGTVPSPSNGGF